MNVTKHTLTIKNTTIEYELQRKKVENINGDILNDFCKTIYLKEIKILSYFFK